MEMTTDSKAITRAYFDSLLLEQRLVGSIVPSTETVIFDHRFETPIMTAALSHLKTFNPDAQRPMEAYAEGAARAGAVHWIGMTEAPEFQSVMDCGAKTIRVIKPFADREKVLRQFREAEAANALAVGMDIDHAFSATGDADICQGEVMASYSEAEWKDLIAQTSLPFVVKGVLSVRDACLCKSLGAAGIVVSHHNGRLPSAIPPLMVLPEIRKAVGRDYPVFVDCGISSGLDAYKALALGATAVSVGMHLIPCTLKGGASAVESRIWEMTQELRGLMAKTGVKDTASFDPSVIHFRNF